MTPFKNYPLLDKDNVYQFICNDKVFEIFSLIFGSIALAIVRIFFIIPKLAQPQTPPAMAKYLTCRNSSETMTNQKIVNKIVNKFMRLMKKGENVLKSKFSGVMSSKNLLETYLNFINLELAMKGFDYQLVNLKNKSLIKYISEETYFKSLIMLVNISESSKQNQIFSTLLEKRALNTPRSIMAIINIFDLSNLSQEKSLELISFLFTKPTKGSNQHSFFSKLLDNILLLIKLIKKSEKTEKDKHNKSRMLGLIELLYKIIQEILVKNKNDAFLVNLILIKMNYSFFKSLLCKITFDFNEQKLDFAVINFTSKCLPFEAKLASFNDILKRFESFYQNNFKFSLMQWPLVSCLLKLNYKLDNCFKITSVTVDPAILCDVKRFKHLLFQLICSHQELFIPNIIKFYLSISKSRVQKFVSVCQMYKNNEAIKESKYVDYIFEVSGGSLNIVPEYTPFLHCLDFKTQLEEVLGQIEILISFLSKEKSIIHDTFLNCVSKLIKETSDDKDLEQYEEEFLILEEKSLIPQNELQEIRAKVSDYKEIKQMILMKFIDQCMTKIDLNIFKSLDIFNMIYLIFIQYGDKLELIELAINCLGFSLIESQHLQNLFNQNKGIILKLYDMVKILGNFEDKVETASQVKTTLLNILTLREIHEESDSSKSTQNEKEKEMLSLIEGIFKIDESDQNHFEKSFSLYNLFNYIKKYHSEKISPKTLSLLLSIYVANIKINDPYKNELSIKTISYLVDYDFEFTMNYLLEQIKQIEIKSLNEADTVSLEQQFCSKLLECVYKIVRRYRTGLANYSTHVLKIVLYFFEHYFNQMNDLNLNSLLMIVSYIVKYCGNMLSGSLDFIIRTSLNLLKNPKVYNGDIRATAGLIIFRVIQCCEFTSFQTLARDIYSTIKLIQDNSQLHCNNSLLLLHMKRSMDIIQISVEEFYKSNQHSIQSNNIKVFLNND